MEKYIMIKNNNVREILDSNHQNLNDILKGYESCIKDEESKIHEEFLENLNKDEKSESLDQTLDDSTIIGALVRNNEELSSENQEQYFYYDEDFYDYD